MAERFYESDQFKNGAQEVSRVRGTLTGDGQLVQQDRARLGIVWEVLDQLARMPVGTDTLKWPLRSSGEDIDIPLSPSPKGVLSEIQEVRALADQRQPEYDSVKGIAGENPTFNRLVTFHYHDCATALQAIGQVVDIFTGKSEMSLRELVESYEAESYLARMMAPYQGENVDIVGDESPNSDRMTLLSKWVQNPDSYMDKK
jgi:hypothetical protein